MAPQAQGSPAATPTQPQGISYVSPMVNGIDWISYPIDLPAGVLLGPTPTWYDDGNGILPPGWTWVDEVATPPAGSNQSIQQQTVNLLQITAGYDFYWCLTTFRADNGYGDNWFSGANAASDAPVVYPAYPLDPMVTVLLNDSASQRNLMQNPVPLSSMAGTGSQPNRLVMPRLFQATATVTATFYYVGPGALGTPEQYAVAANGASADWYFHLYLTLSGFQVPHGQPLTFLG